ncbi:hypothetical protein CCACVL1_04529 [Corchorus capsularis]|uniref:Myb/SANT-like domain-containing protein n=1 Tax=Corchorus capsularis TaxID=210143 RepID=A0A1R3JRN5_COCAP|nr:hypothetical protein CCACVL1_04529 [Corchorus capsularis]
MDNGDVIGWWNMVQNMVAHVICLVAQWYFIRMQSRKRKITYSMTSERERIREEIMSRIMNSETSRNIVRMGPPAFLSMPPKRNDNEGGTSKSSLVWTPNMDTVLIDALLTQYNLGNKVNGNFTSTAYANVVDEIAKTFNISVEKSQVQSRWKILKNHFAEAWDIFNKTSLSGFNFDPETQVWNAEPEVWSELIKEKPKAKMYINTPIPHYNKMVILYGKDRATGKRSVTAKEMRKNFTCIGSADFTDSTNEVHPTMSQFSVQNARSVEDDDIDMMSPSEYEHVSPLHGSARGNKKAKKSVDKEKNVGEGIKEAIEKVADAIKTSGERLGKKAQISATETVQLLKDLGFEPPLLHVIYSKLTMNVDLLNDVLGFPMEMCRDYILSEALGDLTSFTM